MKKLLVVSIVFAVFWISGLIVEHARATQIPLAFGVTGDTNGTANTVMYRDGNANSAVFQLSLLPVTTTQLSVLVPVAVGAIVSVQMDTNGIPGSVFSVCQSTGLNAGAWVYTSTTSAPGALSPVCK